MVLFDESNRLITEAICEWADIPLPEEDVDRRAEDFLALIEAAASIGYRRRQGRRARSRAEEWRGGLIEEVRAGTLDAPSTPPSPEADGR